MPIEHAIITKKKLIAERWILSSSEKMCKSTRCSFVNRQREQFKRLGDARRLGESLLTLTPQYEAKQIRLFGEMASKGLHLSAAIRSVYWSPSSESALADAEVEYRR